MGFLKRLFSTNDEEESKQFYIQGLNYSNGNGVPKSESKALKLFRKSANLGNASAQWELGLMYERGKGVKQSSEEAAKWYKKAAEQGHARAKDALDATDRTGEGEQGSDKEIVRQRMSTAEQYDLGVAYQFGKGVEQSYEEAVKWYVLSGRQGNSDAQIALDEMYGCVGRVQRSEEENVRWFTLFATHGNPDAQYNLGQMYEHGKGVEQSYKEAIRWYKLAANQNHPDAQFELCLMYEHGIGVKKSIKRAREYLALAIKNGSERSKSYTIPHPSVKKNTAGQRSKRSVDSSKSGFFTYTICIEGNDDSEVWIERVIRNDKDITEFVTSESSGEFGWDSKGEYGPFGSFYAVFDSRGNMRYHLDARDLTRGVSGEKVIFGGRGLLLPDGKYSKNYSVVWVLPKIYISSTRDTLSISNDVDSGGTPLAHSIDLDGDGVAEREFEYLGVGVYPSYVSNGIAYSMYGANPKTMIDVIDSGRCTRSYELSAINPGYSMQWNWYQWSLLRYCTYIALGTLDSQLFAKGRTGCNVIDGPDESGASAIADSGYYSEGDDKTSERLFIEDAWGNVSAWLSNTFFMDDGLYVSRHPSVQESIKGKGVKKILGWSDTGNVVNSGRMYTVSTECWGMPDFNSKEVEGCCMGDRVWIDGSDAPVAYVGGDWCDGTRAGISCLCAYHTISELVDNVGFRLVLLFDVDAAQNGPVNLVDSYDEYEGPFLENGSDVDEIKESNGQDKGEDESNLDDGTEDDDEQIIGTVPYEAEFRVIFSQIDMSYITSNPNLLVSAMADTGFSRLNINIMRNIVFNSSDLLIKLMAEGDCNVCVISRQISDETSLDENKIRSLLLGLHEAI